MTGIILSGGKGTRISPRKAWLEIEGEPVIKTVLSKLAEVFPELVIVTNDTEQYEAFGVKCVGDLVAGKGALGGVYSGLIVSDTEYNFVVANDMPFVDTDLIRYMVGRRNGFHAVVPKAGSLLDPLHALYSKRCIPAIERSFQRGDLRVRSFLGEVRTRYVEEDEIRRFGEPEALFFNINRKEDMEVARVMAGRRER